MKRIGLRLVSCSSGLSRPGRWRRTARESSISGPASPRATTPARSARRSSSARSPASPTRRRQADEMGHECHEADAHDLSPAEGQGHRRRGADLPRRRLSQPGLGRRRRGGRRLAELARHHRHHPQVSLPAPARRRQGRAAARPAQGRPARRQPGPQQGEGMGHRPARGSAWSASRRAATSSARPPPTSTSGAYEPIDDVDQVSCRPDFAIMLYSGYFKENDKDELSPTIRTPAAPPLFLVHASDDPISEGGPQRDVVSGDEARRRLRGVARLRHRRPRLRRPAGRRPLLGMDQGFARMAGPIRRAPTDALVRSPCQPRFMPWRPGRFRVFHTKFAQYTPRTTLGQGSSCPELKSSAVTAMRKSRLSARMGAAPVGASVDRNRASPGMF